MPKKQISKTNWLQTAILRVSRVHYMYVLAYAVMIIIFDSWNLIPTEALHLRWSICAAMLAVTAVVWAASRIAAKSQAYYLSLFGVLIGLDIIVASISVYTQRGMSSKSVILYVIPIIISAATLNRIAIMTTAVLSISAYIYSVLKYFIEHPNEGYKVELYGELVFYSAIFFIVGILLWTLVRSKQYTAIVDK